MAKLTKKEKLIKESIDPKNKYSLDEAIEKVQEFSKAKFDESVDIVFKLGVDPRKTDQMVRGACSLPNGTGKTVRLLVFAKGDKEAEAKEAGADYVGGDDYVEKIQGGWLEFDRIVASPDMMAKVGKIGKILGPRGLMPNPKVGTVTANIKEAVTNVKQGQVQFKTDKGSNVHVVVGKSNFDAKALRGNILAVYENIAKLKPSSAKGIYVKACTVSSTMGPGLKVDLSELR